MKSFLTAALLTATVLGTPAMAFGVSTHSLIPDLSFPDLGAQAVTQDSSKAGK